MILQKYDSYKDSGVEWLGEIPEGWSKYRFKDISLIQTSNVDKKTKEEEQEVLLCNYVDVYKNEFIDNSFNFMKATASKEQITKFSLIKNDVIITKDSETSEDMAEPALIIENLNNVICGYHLALIRSKKFVDNRFIFRLFQASNFHWNFIIKSKGVTRVGLSINNAVKNQELFLPDKETQTQIANFLDKKTSQIDKKIKILQEKISSYEELKKSLINETVCRGLNKNVELKDSEIEWIGDIPKHWNVRRIKNIFTERSEKNLKLGGEPITDNILSVMKDIGVINHRDKGNVGNKMSEDITGYKIVHPKDIVVNKMNVIIGSVGISKEYGALSVIYIILKTKPESIPEFYNYVFRSKYFQKYLRTIATGILEIREAVNSTLFKHQGLPNPPKEEQIQIANHLDEKTTKIDTIVSKIKDQIKTLKEFRKTLINDVVTGKVRVSE